MNPKDRDEYEKLRQGIVRSTQRTQLYVSEFDNIQIELLASSMVYLRKADAFLDSKTATPETYSRVTDARAKLAKTIQDASDRLGISRRQRTNTLQTIKPELSNEQTNNSPNQHEEREQIIAYFLNTLPSQLKDAINAHIKKQNKLTKAT